LRRRPDDLRYVNKKYQTRGQHMDGNHKIFFGFGIFVEFSYLASSTKLNCAFDVDVALPQISRLFFS